MITTIEKQIIDLIKRSKNILLLPSSPIDGDSIGSAVALYLALKKLDKEVTVICSDAIPDSLQFLPNTKIVGHEIKSSKDFIISINSKNAKLDKIKHEIDENNINIIISPSEGRFSENDISFSKGELNYDLIITVDTAELSQLKGIYENNIEMFHELPVINIDHHISNSHFAKINHVDIMSSSTAEMLLYLLESFSKESDKELIDEDVATLLLAGIITDTGSFQNANTTPKSFAASAKLVSYGARQQEIIRHIYKTKQLSQLKLWGRVLSKIQTDDIYRIVWSTVSKQDLRDTNSSMSETSNVIDELMTNAPGAEVVILMKEKDENLVSVSVRTTTNAVDASKIAANFGGGGHTRAAGFIMKNSNLIDAEYKVLNYIREYQKNRLGNLLVEEKNNTDISSTRIVTNIISNLENFKDPQNKKDSKIKIKEAKVKKKTSSASYDFE